MTTDVEFTGPRSPTAPQIARILKAAARRGQNRVEIMRGEAGIVFARRERPVREPGKLPRFALQWDIDYAPGGGHTISNPRRACEIANEVNAWSVTACIPGVYLFTPRTVDGQRLRLFLNAEDYAKIGRGRWQAIVTDQETGHVYAVRGASCGLRCMCDALVTEVIK